MQESKQEITENLPNISIAFNDHFISSPEHEVLCELL